MHGQSFSIEIECLSERAGDSVAIEQFGRLFFKSDPWVVSQEIRLGSNEAQEEHTLYHCFRADADLPDLVESVEWLPEDSYRQYVYLYGNREMLVTFRAPEAVPSALKVILGTGSGRRNVKIKVNLDAECIEWEGELEGADLRDNRHCETYSINSLGYFCRAVLPQDLSAVTAACMRVHTHIFHEVGGFDQERLAVAFNDIALCLKLRDAGWRIVYTPYAELLHHESVSRGYEDSPEKKARFNREYKVMQDRWGEKLTNDPFYNPNFTLQGVWYDLGVPRRGREESGRACK